MVWFVKTGYEYHVRIPSFPKSLHTVIDNEDLLSLSTYRIFKHQLTLLWFSLSSLSSPCCYSIAKSCLTLCDHKDYSTPDPSVPHYLQSLFKFMSIESMMLFSHLILCHPLRLLPSLFPDIGTFSITSGGQSIGASALTSVLPINIQG